MLSKRIALVLAAVVAATGFALPAHAAPTGPTVADKDLHIGAWVGEPYDAAPVTVTAGVAPYTFSTYDAPAGFAIDPETGRLTAPAATAPMHDVFAITVTDGTGGMTIVSVFFDVLAPGTYEVPDQTVHRTVGDDAGVVLRARGFNGDADWEATDLPAGMAMLDNYLYGAIDQVGTYSFTVTVTEGPTTATGTITLVVEDAPPPVKPLRITHNGKVMSKAGRTHLVAVHGKPFRYTMKVTGGTAPYQVKRAGSLSLPRGLRMTHRGDTITIAGTPKGHGGFVGDYGVTVEDSSTLVTTRLFVVRVR